MKLYNRKNIHFMEFENREELERYADELIGYCDIEKVNDHKYRDIESNAVYFVREA